MRIGMLGTRGVPASYSGFETCVESVGARLAARGHRVFVYCRPGRTGPGSKSYRGMERIVVPAIPSKGTETLTHTAASVAHALALGRLDAVVMFGVGNAIFAAALKRVNLPVVLNVDGADWARKKWGALGRRYLLWSESIASRAANVLVADSRAVRRYYEERYQARSEFIPYGADVSSATSGQALRRFNLKPRGYFLAVGRLEPENGIHNLIDAYEQVRPNMPLVVVGDSTYNARYKSFLTKIAPPGVLFTGFQFGESYQELSSNAYAFLFGAEVGGTHPVLVEQLTQGNCVVARWTESNEEVVGDSGILFRTQEQLIEALSCTLKDVATVQWHRAKALERAAMYSWETITDQYELLLEQVVRQ